ncbi:peptidoglycan-binding protein [Methylosinus sp. H3A]|uniref:peptidoglycan-binding domain-containing protein n=1 Tax=Methylosinus sp. H3A TaxID=2785786 RepID=UPI0018C3272A|nr:peptidoglycan-binding domain-containing protein [Methylosinus sp. H3A]MBG0809437.1 peptidoglycan-binding protein [Methylosinus sp. H3A]
MRIVMRAAAAALGIVLASSVGAASLAGPYNPVTQAAQSKLVSQGFDPGTLDGVAGTKTAAAITGFQQKSGLPQSGALDPATLEKLGIGVSTSKPVADWIAVPTQEEIDKLVAAKNIPAQPYSNYVPNAAAAGLSLPGAAILAAMNQSADIYGSRRAGEPKHTDQGYQYTADCLKTNYAPTDWSDIAIHYYCQMSKPRACYTYALSGKSTPAGFKYQRPAAYRGCAAGSLKEAADFVAFVPKTQPLVFQYVMFGQTHAFDHEQEQAIINAFYGVKNPADQAECKAKRPRRTEDPTDGTHCLVSKILSPRLAGKGD